MRDLREDRKLETAWQTVHMFSEREAVIKKEKLGLGGKEDGHGSR